MGGQVGAEKGGQAEWEFGGQVGGIIHKARDSEKYLKTGKGRYELKVP